LLAGATNSKALLIKKGLYQQGLFDIFTPVKSLITPTLDRLQRFEFSLPVAQNVGFHPDNVGNLTDLEINFIWNLNRHRGRLT